MQTLSCSYNELSELDVTQCPSLEVLQCSDNNLTELSLDNNEALVTLECENNQLESLNIKNISNFEVLNISGNAKSEQELLNRETINDLFPDENFRKAILESLFNQEQNNPNRNIYREQLDVIQGQSDLLIANSKIKELTEIDLSDCYKLHSLECNKNHLRYLNLENNEELALVSCDSNELVNLDLSHCKQIDTLSCDFNWLTSLKIDGLDQLKNISCKGNDKLPHELLLNDEKDLNKNKTSLKEKLAIAKEKQSASRDSVKEHKKSVDKER